MHVLVGCTPLSRVVHHTSHVKRHASHVTHHTSHVTHNTSHVTRHTSHVTRHTSHAREASSPSVKGQPAARRAPVTRSAIAARAGQGPDRCERRRGLQAGEAARREARTVDVCMTMGEGGGQSSGTACRRDVQVSARVVTLPMCCYSTQRVQAA